MISATGVQIFTLDLGAGIAGVTSDLKGTAARPAESRTFLNYDLYNIPASTSGTVVLNGSAAMTGELPAPVRVDDHQRRPGGPDIRNQARRDVYRNQYSGPALPRRYRVRRTHPPRHRPGLRQEILPGIYNAGDSIGTSSSRTVTILRAVPNRLSPRIWRSGCTLPGRHEVEPSPRHP